MPAGLGGVPRGLGGVSGERFGTGTMGGGSYDPATDMGTVPDGTQHESAVCTPVA